MTEERAREIGREVLEEARRYNKMYKVPCLGCKGKGGERPMGEMYLTCASCGGRRMVWMKSRHWVEVDQEIQMRICMEEKECQESWNQSASSF